MKLKKGFKNILITDYDLIQEINEIRDRRIGIRFMLDGLSKISGGVEANRIK